MYGFLYNFSPKNTKSKIGLHKFIVVLPPEIKPIMYIRIVFLGACLMLTQQYIIAQTNVEYSSRMKSVYTDKSKTVQGLLDSSDIYLVTNRDKCFDFLEQAYLISLKKENYPVQYQVYRKIGDFYQYYQQYELAAQNYQSSLTANVSVEEQYIYVLKAGKQFLLAKQAEKAITLYKKYYLRNLPILTSMYFDESLGDCYFDLKNYQLALNYFRKAAQTSEKLNRIDDNTRITLKSAKVLSVSNPEEALVVLNQANVKSKASSNKKTQMASELQLAEYYQQNNLPEQEIVSRKNIITHIESNAVELESLNVDVSNMKLEETVNIAKTLNKQNKYNEALEILEGADFKINKATSNKTLELKKEAAKISSEAYLKTGQEQKALKSYEGYVELLDQLYLQKELEYTNVNELSKQLQDHQWRIDFLEKDKAIYDAELLMMAQESELKTEQLKFRNWSIILLLTMAFILGFALIMVYKRYKLQQKHNLFLDLKSLRTQMNPHFIFNALNSVNNFIAKNDELNANKYLVRFSKLMRSILDNSDQDFIPLAKEIELLELYLQLENMRFPDKFNFQFEVDKNVVVEGFEIPPMLIQPYIENAIWHGLRYKDGLGLLKVHIGQQNEMLQVSVEDNGIGRKKSAELKTENQKNTQSRGLKNTQKRLEILAKIYKQTIHLNIEDVEANGEGTRVELLIPDLQLKKSIQNN